MDLNLKLFIINKIKSEIWKLLIVKENTEADPETKRGSLAAPHLLNHRHPALRLPFQ